jgi:hypothetical protein
MYKKSVRYQVLGDRRILFPFIIILSFILHPSFFAYAQHSRLYACTLGSDDPASFMGGSSLGGGLWQSNDTGKTWKQLGWKHVKCYSVDVVNKSNGKIIYEACGNGVLKSTDAGANWKMMTDWRITEVMDIAVDQKSPKNIYIATPGAIWKSDDDGNNWYEADADIPQPIFVSRIKIDPSDHLKIYAATELGLFESKDGGSSWKKRVRSVESVRDMMITSHGLSALIEEKGGLYTYFEWTRVKIDTNLWTFARTQNKFFFGGAKGVYTIQNMLQASPTNVHSIISVGNNLIIGSLSDGVWKNDLSSENSSCKRSGLEKLQIWRLKIVDIK